LTCVVQWVESVQQVGSDGIRWVRWDQVGVRGNQSQGACWLQVGLDMLENGIQMKSWAKKLYHMGYGTLKRVIFIAV